MISAPSSRSSFLLFDKFPCPDSLGFSPARFPLVIPLILLSVFFFAGNRLGLPRSFVFEDTCPGKKWPL